MTNDEFKMTKGFVLLPLRAGWRAPVCFALNPAFVIRNS
jgi:hypothetical protein